jgi:hypothetical protein
MILADTCQYNPGTAMSPSLRVTQLTRSQGSINTSDVFPVRFIMKCDTSNTMIRTLEYFSYDLNYSSTSEWHRDKAAETQLGTQ